MQLAAHWVAIFAVYLYMAEINAVPLEAFAPALSPFVVRMIDRGWVGPTNHAILGHDAVIQKHGHPSILRWCVVVLSALTIVTYWAGSVDQTTDAAAYLLIANLAGIIAAAAE